MLVSPSKVIFADEISTGLDSSTTFQIIQNLSHYAHKRRVRCQPTVGIRLLLLCNPRKAECLRCICLSRTLSTVVTAVEGPELTELPLI
jgi:ABC-type Mn2+/Zn2+ transport system ATPase subunit